MVNKVILIGNLGQDPEVKKLDSGSQLTKFNLATTDSYKDKNGEWQKQTEWHRIVLWRDLAERAGQQLVKGSRIYLEGKLTYDKWEDKDGNKRETAQVKAIMFRNLTAKPKDDDAPPPNNAGNGNNEKDDLPF